MIRKSLIALAAVAIIGVGALAPSTASAGFKGLHHHHFHSRVLALDSVGWSEEAHRVFGWIQELRGSSGAYWMGTTFPEGRLWPEEQPTWTSAAVLLAADALADVSATAGLFRRLTAAAA